MKHIWVIEANSNGEWIPLCFPTLERAVTSHSRAFARKQAKYIFEHNQYNQAFIKGLSKFPACRYRVVKYKRGE